jgi:crotonobetainyl-CoA:carnitine CoA-transferase CaiB-like acyl-CoA transferase
MPEQSGASVDTENGRSGPLKGLTVVDLTWGVAGPLATMFMADYGADVIKVEPPGGDPFRAVLPAYTVWQRGKKSLTLNLKSDSGARIFRRLLGQADVMIESFAPGAVQRLGIDYPSLAAEFPRLIYCSIRGYGDERDADHPGYDALVQARAGLFGEQSGVREGPVFSYYPLASYAAAYLSLIGVMSALHVRSQTGAGQRVETSLFDGVMAHFALQLSQAEKPTASFRAYRGSKRHVPPSVDSYQCADGRYLHIHTGAKGAFERCCELVGLDAKEFPGYYKGRHFVGDREQGERFRQELSVRFRTRPMMEWVAALREADVAVGPCLEAAAGFEDEQARAMDMIAEVFDPRLGTLREAGLPIKYGETPGAITHSAPELGANTGEILRGLGIDQDEQASLRTQGAI